MRWTNFVACWACAERFITCWACAEMFKSWISRPNLIRFLQAIGTVRFWFLRKRVKKESFMLVYLKIPRTNSYEKKIIIYFYRANFGFWGVFLRICHLLKLFCSWNFFEILHDKKVVFHNHTVTSFKPATATLLRIHRFLILKCFLEQKNILKIISSWKFS
jgi:hypothetical protein